MKKANVFILSVIIIFSLMNVQAQDEAYVSDASYIGTEISFNWGIMWDDSFSFDPYFPEYGFAFDFVFSTHFMLSPEIYLVSQRFSFDPLWVAPGILANFKIRGFFIGAGISKWFNITGAGADSEWLFKINGGIDKNHRLTLFITTPFNDFFGSINVGITIGFRF